VSGDEKHSEEKHGDEKNIGRRTFIGLLVAGILALFVGKDIFPRLTTGGSSSGTTSVTSSFGGSSNPTAGFRINTVKQGPAFDPATWRLTVDGLVGTPLTFTFSQFTDLPQTKLVRDFYCVEGWGVKGVEWKGVAVKELMQRAQVDPNATHLIFHSSDGVYADSLTLEQAALADSLLVHEVNGILLPVDMGQPLRLIYPNHYGYKYVKWVERVQAINEKETPFIGYWEGYGYSVDATP
jgi:methionine sulfoxide reductase catalytic subunit